MESVIWIDLLANYGFSGFIAIVLLYDKIKSNAQLKKAVENNTRAINNIYQYLGGVK